MKIEEICQYLNELGILSIKNTPLFLSIYSGLIGNNKQYKNNSRKNNNIENNKLTIILFAFLKKIISNDKELYELCSNIINTHSKNKIIKQYQGICFLNKVIFYQIKNRFNHFLFLLFKRKYPKRKYFPYNPLYAAKSSSRINDINPNISLTNTNTRRKNNFLNLNEENSLSYFSNKNNNKHYNKIVFNTGSDELNKSENLINKHNIIHPKIIKPDLVEKINNKRKEISMNNMKKKLYDAQIRINNYENIIPISRKNRQKEMKSREEEDYYNKLKEDKIYQKLTEKELDSNNILDRLYRKEIIKKQELKMKEKENKKRDKSPIDWDKVNSLNSKKKYLNININSQDINSIKEIINKPQKNFGSSREMFSFGNPTNNDKIKFNQNNMDNKNKIDYNDFIKNKKKILELNKNDKEMNLNNDDQNDNEDEYEDNNNKNIKNNNYLNLKQLDENEIEENLNKNEGNEYEFNINEKNQNKNRPQLSEKYTFGKVSTQKNDNKLPNEKNNNIEEENEMEMLPQNDFNNLEENKNGKNNNFSPKFENENNEGEYQGNEEEQNQEEEIIYNNNPLPNEENDYQYENNNEDEGEEEYGNEEYELENEEIEYDINNNIEKEKDLNLNHNNENEKNPNENINYEELLVDNIDEYLDEEDKQK